MLGTVISVLVTLSMLILYRQLDKKSNTLKRLKNREEIIYENLDKLVQEKIEGIDQATINLETEKKGAIAAIKRIESIEKDIEERTQSFTDVQKHINVYDAAIRELVQMTERAETNLKNLQAHQNFTDTLAKKLNAAQGKLDVISKELPSLQETFKTQNNTSMDNLKNDIFSKFQEQINKIEDLYAGAMEMASVKANKLEESTFEKLKSQATERALKFKEQIDAKYSELRENTKEELVTTQNLLKTFKSDWEDSSAAMRADWEKEAESLITEWKADSSKLKTDWEEESNKLKASWQNDSSVVKTAWQTESNNMRETLSSMQSAANESMRILEQRADELANQALSSINMQLDSYKNEVKQKFLQLDNETKDIERIETELRLFMAEIAKQVSADFEIYKTEQNERYVLQEKDFESKHAGISSRMTNLETELSDLQAKAYGTASERIKNFEDEFAQNLTERTNNINLALADWQAKISEELNTISSDTDARQKDAIAGLSENMKKELLDVQDKFKLQTLNLDELVTSSGKDLQTRISQYEETLNQFTEKYRADMQEVRGIAEASLHREIDNYALSTQEYIREQEKKLSAQTQKLQEDVTTSQADATTAIENAKSDFSLWKTRIEQDMAESKENLKQKILGMDRKTGELLDEMRKAFDAEKDEIAVHISEQQASIQDRTYALESQLETISSSLDEKTKNVETTIRGVYTEALADVQARIKQGSLDADTKLREIKQHIQDMTDRTETTEDSLLQKIENRATLLNQNLDEIDKRQKAFIAQTRLFDRADELKTSLETSISNIKDDINRIQDWKRDISEMDVQFTKIKKQEAETSQKLSKFLTERRRIDELEAKYNRLVDLSQSMDQKLSDVSMADSQIQQFQLDLRKCQEGLEAANTRFDRLEKKEHILDQTTERIDKVFSKFTEMERQAKELREALQEMPDQVSDIGKNLRFLADNKDRAEIAINKMDDLDDMLKTLETRLGKLKNEEEWLASTETRLNDVSKQSKDYIALLQTLVSKDFPKKLDDKRLDKPTRDQIRQLKQLGWTSQQINEQLGVAISEIDLILMIDE